MTINNIIKAKAVVRHMTDQSGKKVINGYKTETNYDLWMKQRPTMTNG